MKPWTVPRGFARIWTLFNEQLDVSHSGPDRQRSGAAFFFVKEGFDGEPMGRIGL